MISCQKALNGESRLPKVYSNVTSTGVDDGVPHWISCIGFPVPFAMRNPGVWHQPAVKHARVFEIIIEVLPTVGHMSQGCQL